MGYTIERTEPGDEAALACIQTKSWKAAFRDILSPDELERCTDVKKATAMYRRLQRSGKSGHPAAGDLL